MVRNVHVLCAVKHSRPSGTTCAPSLFSLRLSFSVAASPTPAPLPHPVMLRNATNRATALWKFPFFIPFENIEATVEGFIIIIILTFKTHKNLL